MPYSNFPNGFTNGVTIRGVPLQQAQPGQVFFVNNSSVLAPGGIAGSNGNKGTYQQPFRTLDYAIGRCVAGRGDIIFIMPGHAETVSSATAIVVDVSGVAIIGLGSGDARPTFTFDTVTSASIYISAANVSIMNCIFSANFADILFPISVSAKDCLIDSNLFTATATNMNFRYGVDTSAATNGNDGLTVTNNVWVEPDLATETFVRIDGNTARLTVTKNRLTLGVRNNTPSLVAIATTKVVTSANISDNYVYRLNTDSATGALLVATDVTTNTGIISGNFVQHADTAAEILVTASSGFGVFENRASGVAGASGYLLPAADS